MSTTVDDVMTAVVNAQVDDVKKTCGRTVKELALAHGEQHGVSIVCIKFTDGSAISLMHSDKGMGYARFIEKLIDQPEEGEV